MRIGNIGAISRIAVSICIFVYIDGQVIVVKTLESFPKDPGARLGQNLGHEVRQSFSTILGICRYAEEGSLWKAHGEA